MAPVTAEPDVSKLTYTNAVFAVLVTLILGVSVVHRWHAYRLFDRCFALFVLVFLVTLPWSTSRMEKRGQKMELWYVYLVVLMVDGLFH
jgi:hypothetical protein